MFSDYAEQDRERLVREQQREQEVKAQEDFLRRLLDDARTLSLPDPVVPYELTTWDRAFLIFGKIQP